MNFNYSASNPRQHYLQQSQTPLRQSQKLRYSEIQLSIHSKHDYQLKPEIQSVREYVYWKEVGRNGQLGDELQEDRRKEKRKGK